MTSALVLITGATGHLGFRVMQIALESGYRVRAAIRQAEQETKVRKVRSVQPYQENLSFVVVGDITRDDAYEVAVQSVDYVIHCASPIASNANNQGETWSDLFYDPAVKGTVSMLKAASQSRSVRRVIVTSSIYCLEGWNTGEIAGADDLKAPPSRVEAEKITSRVEAYGLSKIFAHAAATDYMERYKPDFELIRITSGWIQGANELNEIPSDVRNGSNNGIMQVALGENTWSPKLTGQVFLDDVAKAHVVSLSPDVKTEGAKTSFIVAGNGGEGIPWDEIADEIRRRFPREVEAGLLTPLAGQESIKTSFDVAPSEEALGFRFAGKEKMVESVVGQYLALLAAVGRTSRRR